MDELTNQSVSCTMLVLACWFSFACTSKDEDCSGVGVSPVAGEVRDVSGTPICSAQIHVTAPGLDKMFECSSDAGSSDGACCSFRVYGGPADTEYTIDATANGYAPKTTTVFVPQGECGQPVPQYVTVELSPP